jgi:hypothetical protein
MYPTQQHIEKAIKKFRQQRGNIMSNAKWHKLFDFIREKKDKPHHIDSFYFTQLNFNEHTGYTFKNSQHVIHCTADKFFNCFLENRIPYIDYGGPIRFDEFLEFAIPFEAQYATHNPPRPIEIEQKLLMPTYQLFIDELNKVAKFSYRIINDFTQHYQREEYKYPGVNSQKVVTTYKFIIFEAYEIDVESPFH